MLDNDICFIKSKKIASRIVKLNEYLCDERKEFILSKQILRTGTGICANLAETVCGSPKKGFRNKKLIALKECNETLYWLGLLKENNYITKEWFDNVNKDCEGLRKVLVRLTKKNL